MKFDTASLFNRGLAAGGGAPRAGEVARWRGRASLVLIVGVAACKPHHGGTESDGGSSDSHESSGPSCALETIEGDVELTDSADLSAYHCVSEITGDLTVWSVSTLVDFSDFGSLERVGGTLRIRDNQALETLAGLEQLESIGDRLEIEQNGALKDVSVPALQEAQFVSISGNPELSTLAGLGASSWTVQPSWVSIVGNDSLVSLAGIAALLNESTNLSLLTNPALADLKGLEAVESLHRLNLEELDGLSDLSELAQLRTVEILRVGGNDGLVSLTGLGGLETVEYLTLGDCAIETETDNVASFAGLESLKSVTHLEISRHNALSSLAALDVLAGTTIETLVIAHNPQLPQSEIDAFTSAVTVSTIVELCQNGDDDVPCMCGGGTE